MKNLLLLLLTLCTTATLAQTKPVAGSIVVMKESVNNDWKYSNDTLSVSFTPSEDIWKAVIKNSSEMDISVNWDKSSFILNGQANKIIFEYNENTVEIPSGSHILKELYPDNFSGMPTISKRFVKKRFDETGNPDKIKIVFALEVDGNPHKYDFNFEITPYVKPKK